MYRFSIQPQIDTGYPASTQIQSADQKKLKAPRLTQQDLHIKCSRVLNKQTTAD